MVTIPLPTRELVPESLSFLNSLEARDSLGLKRGEAGNDVGSLTSTALVEPVTRNDPPRAGSLFNLLAGWSFGLGFATRSCANRLVFPGKSSGPSALFTCTIPSRPGGCGRMCGGLFLIFSSRSGPIHNDREEWRPELRLDERMLASSTLRMKADSPSLILTNCGLSTDCILAPRPCPRRISWLTVDSLLERMGASESCVGPAGAKSTGMHLVRRRDSPTRAPDNKLRAPISSLVFSSAAPPFVSSPSSRPPLFSPCNACAISFLGLGSSTGLLKLSVQNPANSPPRCGCVLACACFVSALAPACHGSVNPTNDAGTCTTPQLKP